MAEMNVPESGAKKGKKKSRSKKMSTRVDLTAMVDLGFLLITFFMLATTFNKPKTMEVIKPAKDDNEDKKDQPAIKMSKTFTLLLGDNNKVYAYTSPDEVDATTTLSVDSVDYSSKGLRRVIQERQKEVARDWGHQDTIFIMIKPLPKSKVKNTVDVLDEMSINGVKRYAILAADDPIDSLICLTIRQSRK
ncbi:MAG: biopolymer transporter ExbD [Saprospiraceae bacterium]|nr:biopolymer transporter ExbD [Saprospiraceae bacterium]MBK7809745.1 biopolymer transporter ExbD [Saprospiraceae bacterium]MBK9632145.1 biopolymer transporter ExbD [Saprospiraceae bacterium]